MQVVDLLDYYSTDWIFGFFLILTRVGTALMFFPGFGESYVNPRSRLALALMIALVMTPVLLPILPGIPASVIDIGLSFVVELLIGAFFGLVTRAIFIALEMAGVIMSFQVSLGNATIFNPLMSAQGSILSVFITVAGLLLIFVLDLHHLMLLSVLDSYSLFSPFLSEGFVLPTGDMANYFATAFSQAFMLAMQLSAPLLIVGLIFYLGLGLLGRLMPQMQVFFVAIPLQIFLGFFVLSLFLSAAMLWFLEHFENRLEGFLAFS